MKRSGQSADSMVDAWVEQFIKAAIEAMGRLGMECVNHARRIPKDIGFEDHTGNLRSSIGFQPR